MGGHLRAGDPGLRLFEPLAQASLGYATHIPGAYQASPAAWVVVDYPQLFGSEELSQRSAVFQQRMAEARLYLNNSDSARLGFPAGGLVEFSWGGSSWRLPVALSDQLAPGLVGLPLGQADLPRALHHQQIVDLREVQP